MTGTYSETPNKTVSAANGINYAYRQVGDGELPLVLLQHFRGNLDNWDPALIDAVGVDSAGRHVRQHRSRCFDRNDAEHRGTDGG